MLEFGDIIKRKREEKGWTQKELGEKLFVSDKAVSRWENNKSYPDITILMDIAKVLDFDYQELIEGQAYVQRKIERKKKIRNITTILIILLILSGILLGISVNKRNEKLGKDYLGIDFLNSTKWSYFSFENKQGNSWYEKIYSDYQQNEILSFLDVDFWEEIPQMPKKAKEVYYLKFGNDLKFEEYRVYEFDNQWYVVFEKEFYMGNSVKYGLLSTYNKIYECHKELTDFYEFLKKLPEYKFNFNHPLINNTDFKQLTEQEILNLDEALYAFDLSRDIMAGTLLVNKNGPFYFYFSSHQQNVTEISFVDGIVHLKGESRHYNTPYVCLFEITNPDSIEEIQYNGEYVFRYGVDYRGQ